MFDPVDLVTDSVSVIADFHRLPAIAEHHLTAELGFDSTCAVTLHVAAGYAPRVTISGANAAYPAQCGQAIASYSTAMSQYTVDAGVTWRL